MLGHVEMQDLPAIVMDHEPDVEDPERRRRHREEVHRRDLAPVCLDE